MLTPMFLSVGSTTATVKRYGQGSYLHGRWVDGAETTFTITANIQPHTVKNISDTTAEGNKSKKAIKVFTTTTLRMTQEGTAGGALVIIRSHISRCSTGVSPPVLRVCSLYGELP